MLALLYKAVIGEGVEKALLGLLSLHVFEVFSWLAGFIAISLECNRETPIYMHPYNAPDGI